MIKKLKSIFDKVMRIEHENQETRLLIGTLLAKKMSLATSLREAEFKVFSQFGDDGIIQFLINKLVLSVHTFVELGVETYEESNTRFLLLHNNWQGLVIDGVKFNIDYIKKDPLYWRHDLTAVNAFITAENVNQLLSSSGFNNRIGILSLDIDGNDYWVWKAITAVDADVVVIEYNSLFGRDRAIVIPYEPNFVRTTAHYSNLYFGASLAALCDLGEAKGYAFVGCNQAGNNAYFVKTKLLGDLPSFTAADGYMEARFREARNRSGELTFASPSIRREEITGLPVVNVRTGLLESF